jgi:hypothetical protein
VLPREMVVTLKNTRRQNPEERSQNLYNFVIIRVTVAVGIEFTVFLKFGRI